MKTWSLTTYELDDRDSLTICPHPRTGEVSLSVSATGGGEEQHGRGFALFLRPRHMASIAALLEALHDLTLEGDRDATI